MSRLQIAAIAAVEEAAEEATEQAVALIAAFQRWETTRKYAVDERKRCGDRVAEKLAAFKEAIEVGHSTEDQQLLKLTVVESRWQDLEEARAERKNVMASCRESMKLAEGRLRELIAERNSTQLSLFNGKAEEEAPEEYDDTDDE
jgi:hypothetical protein